MVIKFKKYWRKTSLKKKSDGDFLLRHIEEKKPKNFLEIGVGSGCIILSILKERDDFKGSGIDISSECIKTCKINAYNLKIKNILYYLTLYSSLFNFMF